jgi:hypothetical protein
MDELERFEELGDKVTEFQKKYNINQKNFAHILGKNLTLFICMLVPLLLIGFVWTDFKEIVVSTKMFSDGIITVMLFTIGEIMMARLGTEGGKLDQEFIEAKRSFDVLLDEVGKIGTMLMGVFCDWQIDVEMEQAIHFRLRMLRMTPKTWEEIKDKTPEELEAKYGKKKAKKILEIINLKPIELNEAILLYNGEYAARGGVPISGDAYLKSKKSMIETVVACIFTGLLTVTVVVTLTSDITFARVIYTVFKLTMLLFRMAKGYDRGAKAYNTIEVRQYKAKANYLRQYLKFIEDKTYLKLEDKYGDISCFVTELSTESATTTVEK